MSAAETSAADSIDSSTASNHSAPPSRPSSTSDDRNVQARLPAALANAPCRVDAFLTHLSRCIQTRSGADTVLLFACYATRLSASLLEGAGGLAVRQAARRLVAQAYKGPRATALVLTTAPRPSLAAAARQVGMRLRVLSGLISETRTMARLWGLLGLYAAVKKMLARQTEHETDAAESALDTLVAAAQLASLVVFQATENVAFLSSKNVLPASPASQARLGLLSVRAWGLYVAIEAARLLVERARRQSSSSTSSSAADKTDWQGQWNKSFYRNLAWAPLTLHWGSGTGGFLPDVAISLLAFYPAVGAMVDLWKETRS